MELAQDHVHLQTFVLVAEPSGCATKILINNYYMFQSYGYYQVDLFSNSMYVRQSYFRYPRIGNLIAQSFSHSQSIILLSSQASRDLSGSYKHITEIFLLKW
jgi:hypothetical protein